MATADDRPGSRDEDRDAEWQDRSAVDRAFADLIAGYHLTADRPESPAAPPTSSVPSKPPPPAAVAPPAPVASPSPAEESRAGWADDHPLFRFEPAPVPEPEPELHERYEPPPLPPLPRPAWPVLVAWLGMGYAVLTMLAVVVGVRLPSWAGWLALLGFVGGFGILVTRLPRERPPDAGDGAVL